MSAGFDLDPESRDALELLHVLEYAAGFASSTPGRERLLASRPRTEVEALRREHASVEQAKGHLERIGRLLPSGIPDPGPALAALEVAGLVVDPIPLRDLASVLLEAADLRKRLSKLDEPELSALAALGREIPDLGGLAREVAQHVAPDGTIADEASAELRRIRVAIGKTGERLRRQLLSFVHDPAASSVVRDDFVTQRGGRFVIPVRTDAPRPVEGIVHAASSSGQTLFVEPLESVPLNNELVRLAEDEVVEQERVLRGWSERYRARREEIALAVDRLALADTLQARALFAQRIDGCAPSINERAALRLVAVRHPLLDRRLQEQGARSVPLTIEIDPYDRVLVISGPNTGGKTVALKTIGLAALMAQCGLPVAASAASLPAFRQLRADIGDHQSIEADLSTFSAHVRATARDLAQADPPALFLFDEIGTGTEPGEGAALAQAVLERLLELKVTTIATTHHASLKAWAFADPRVASAAMEFDEQTLRPTYRVIPGAAGSSAGIDIAARLGLDAALVARARDLLGDRGVTAEAYMARLRRLTGEAEERERALVEAEERLAEERERASRRSTEEAVRQRERAARALEEAMAKFEDAARRELAGIADAKARAAVAKTEGRAQARLRGALRESRRAVDPAPPEAPARPAAIAPGARVRIVSLERDGEIVAIRGDRIDVRMGSATFTVARADVAAAGEEAPAPAPAGRPRLAALAAASRGSRTEGGADPAPLELHLLGKTVDEALPEVERFLDACIKDGRTEVRIVHGHGTGRLRAAIRSHLKTHPLVDAFRPGGTGEGGDGATVVTLH